MSEDIFNLGLTPQHADGRVRSGMQRIEVLFLPKGTEIYRFQTAGSGLGGWWSSAEVVAYMQQMAALTGMSLAAQARIGSAVLHGWSKLDELITGVITHSCMVFRGVGRPQTEIIPQTCMKLTYASCKAVPQLYVPSRDLVNRTGRSVSCVSVRSRKRLEGAALHGGRQQPLSPDDLKQRAVREARKAQKLDQVLYQQKRGQYPS
jgi:hypothetical protein